MFSRIAIRVGLSGYVIAGIACASAPLAAQAPAANSTRDLPVVWTEPIGPPSKRVVVLMSGDGGFAELVTHLGNGLAAHGLGVVTLNSRAYLSSTRTPQQAADDVGRLSRAALAWWHADSLVIVGYSRGADFAPFVVNRFAADLRSRTSAMAMFGLAPMASFEFHLMDLVKDTPRETDLPVEPELLRLRGLPMLCVFGKDEAVSACRDAPGGLMRVDARNGAHHFDGNLDALVNAVLALLGLTP